MDSESILHEIQNNVSAHQQDANLQHTLDKLAFPANNEEGEHTSVEAVQNELAWSECLYSGTDEEILVDQTELCGFFLFPA